MGRFMDYAWNLLFGLAVVLVTSFVTTLLALPEHLKGAGWRWLRSKSAAVWRRFASLAKAIEARRRVVEQARVSVVAIQDGVVDLTPHEAPEQGPARSRSRLKAAAALDDFAAGLGGQSVLDDFAAGLGRHSVLDEFAAGLGRRSVLDDFASGLASSRVLDDFAAATAFHEKFEEAQRQARWQQNLMDRMTEIRDRAKLIESYACRNRVPGISH